MRLLRNVLHSIKEHPNCIESIIDSFSDNQHISKESLIECLDINGLIDEDSTVVILGCWYGSILVDRLAPIVKQIVAVDMDEETIKIGREFFKHYKNIDWVVADVFNDEDKAYYKEANLIINTSCEHMKNMVEWNNWDYIKSDPLYIAVQSNDMFGIEGHINCVKSIEDFRDQLPKCFWIKEESIKDSRGTRFMLVGQYLREDDVNKMK